MWTRKGQPELKRTSLNRVNVMEEKLFSDDSDMWLESEVIINLVIQLLRTIHLKTVILRILC